MIEQSPQSMLWRAGFSFILMWGMAIGMIAQLAVSVLAPFIIDDLGLSRTHIGLLSMVYFAVGATGSLIAGPCVDRFGGRLMMAALFLVGGISLSALSAGSSMVFLLIAMGIAGIATAISNPVTNQLVAVHLPRGLQGTAIGIKQAGVGVVTLLAGSIYPWLAGQIGWRDALLVSATLSSVGVLGAMALIPKLQPRHSGSAVRRHAFRNQPPVIWRLAVYAFLMGTAGSVTMVFLVLYGVEAVSLSPEVAGSSLAVMGAVGVAARVLWGRIAEHLASPILVLGLLSVLAATSQALIWAAASVGPWSLWCGVILYGASAMGWNSVVMVTVVRKAAREQSGAASGVVQAAFYSGYILSPAFFGWLADQAGGYGFGWAAVTMMSLLATVHTVLWHRAANSVDTDSVAP